MKKLLSIILLVSVLIVSSFSVFATSGTVTYTHGNNPSLRKAFGKISSYQPENSLRISITISYSNGQGGYTTESSVANLTQHTHYSNVLRGSGDSYCRYYINGVNTHNSTAPFPFSF